MTKFIHKIMINIGITINTLKNFEEKMYINGIYQNIMFLYNYFTAHINYNVVFVSNNKNDKYNSILLSDIHKYEELDYLFIIGTFPLDLEEIFEKTKVIWWHLGNDYIYETSSILKNTDVFTNLRLSSDKFHEVWISPHFEYSIDYYKYIYSKNEIFVAPYIWSSDYMEKPYTHFNNEHLNIGVFESNINYGKTCFVPVMVCEKARNIIDKAMICGSKKLYARSENFRAFAAKSKMFNEKRLTFEDRHRFKYVMDNYCNVVVSFVENWDLNYLHLECFYLGIPLIHNSKMLKEWGYYYDGYNVDAAYEHIKWLKVKGNFSREKYIERHKPLLKKYSMENTEYQQFFEKRLLNLSNDSTIDEDTSGFDDRTDSDCE